MFLARAASASKIICWRLAILRKHAVIHPLLRHSFTRTHGRESAEEDLSNARIWLRSLNTNKLPVSIGDVSYSRSSGPGGQNVNKVNSKAQLRVSLQTLLPLVPTVLHQAIRGSRYYAPKTDSLLIQADESRKQAINKDACHKKLHDMLMDVGRQIVPGETPQAQKDKVKTLKHQENEARLKAKKQHSSKKVSRSRSFGE